MSCPSCQKKFTVVIRRPYKCINCDNDKCMKCIRMNFEESYESKCLECKLNIHPEIYHLPKYTHIHNVYTFIRNEEEKCMKGWLKYYYEYFTNYSLLLRDRLKLIRKHVDVYPYDWKMIKMLSTDCKVEQLCISIEYNTELTKCTKCENGRTSIHDTSLQHLCRLKIIMEYDIDMLPLVIRNYLLSTNYRRCLTCNSYNDINLHSTNNRVVERRCHNCGFLIMFYKKHNTIDTLCCPKCSVLFSRWGGPIRFDLVNMYKTFFEFSCNLVDGDVRDL